MKKLIYILGIVFIAVLVTNSKLRKEVYDNGKVYVETKLVPAIKTLTE